MRTLTIKLTDDVVAKVDEIRWRMRAQSRRATLVALIERAVQASDLEVE